MAELPAIHDHFHGTRLKSNAHIFHINFCVHHKFASDYWSIGLLVLSHISPDSLSVQVPGGCPNFSPEQFKDPNVAWNILLQFTQVAISSYLNGRSVRRPFFFNSVIMLLTVKRIYSVILTNQSTCTVHMPDPVLLISCVGLLFAIHVRKYATKIQRYKVFFCRGETFLTVQLDVIFFKTIMVAV